MSTRYRKTPAQPGPKSQKDSPGPPNAVSLWRYFATDRLICRNVQIASTLEQNPYFWCSEVPEFRDIPNIFQNLSADNDGCTTFPILSNLRSSLEALWDSKAPNKGHKTCGNLGEWHLRVTHLGGRGTLQAPRWLGDSFFSPGGLKLCPNGVVSAACVYEIVQTLHELLSLLNALT